MNLLNIKSYLNYSFSTPMRKILFTEGKISPAECKLLYDLARITSSGCIVEIGSFRGRSTVALGLGTMSGSRLPVFAIEPHESFVGELGGHFGPKDRVAFFRNLLRAGVVETVRLINLTSDSLLNSWDKEIGLLWIDGDHRYESVKKDFMQWSKFIKKNGAVALHDSVEPGYGPYKVIEEALESKSFELIKQIEATTVLRKVK